MSDSAENWRNWTEEQLLDQLADQRIDPGLAQWTRAKLILDWKISEKNLFLTKKLASATTYLSIATGALVLATVGLILATLHR